MNSHRPPASQGLYDSQREHDACGVGFVAHIKGVRSHSIVEQGLTLLKNLSHRGAVGWDPKLSDGAGLLTQIPDKFFREEMAKQGVKLPKAGQYGIGMVFMPQDPASRLACKYELERAIREEGQVLLGWRDVPVDNSDLAVPARNLEPVIQQLFIGRGKGITVADALERKLYIIRKSAGHAIQALRLEHGKEYYVPSMSVRTINFACSSISSNDLFNLSTSECSCLILCIFQASTVAREIIVSIPAIPKILNRFSLSNMRIYPPMPKMVTV